MTRFAPLLLFLFALPLLGCSESQFTSDLTGDQVERCKHGCAPHPIREVRADRCLCAVPGPVCPEGGSRP